MSDEMTSYQRLRTLVREVSTFTGRHDRATSTHGRGNRRKVIKGERPRTLRVGDVVFHDLPGFHRTMYRVQKLTQHPSSTMYCDGINSVVRKTTATLVTVNGVETSYDAEAILFQWEVVGKGERKRLRELQSYFWDSPRRAMHIDERGYLREDYLRK